MSFDTLSFDDIIPLQSAFDVQRIIQTEKRSSAKTKTQAKTQALSKPKVDNVSKEDSKLPLPKAGPANPALNIKHRTSARCYQIIFPNNSCMMRALDNIALRYPIKFAKLMNKISFTVKSVGGESKIVCIFWSYANKDKLRDLMKIHDVFEIKHA